ncbi:hypothetical protein IKG24_00045 [Candidatus Saccharibacteria bacterium]|nr:hypothetical protein [Candidatus Saccharibacteria bacterium]
MIRRSKSFVVASIALILVVVFVYLNFGVIKDIVVGMGYRPSSEMAAIRESLELTNIGSRIFNAVQPELKEKQEFNQRCREIENEDAILGCYTEDKVYVYNIIDAELEGIRELTAAHELLHAVYHRMGDKEKDKWAKILSSVYEDNKDTIGVEIDIYSDDQKMEELYVRVGTEIKKLPDELENHYAEIFKDQDKIVDYYESYISVFREIEKKLEELHGKASELEAEINGKTDEYKTAVANLNAEVGEFNECAKTPNCFSSNYVFNTKRAALVLKQENLSAMYDDINNLINSYNAIVAEYNENVLHGQMLNMTINSSEKVNEF